MYILMVMHSNQTTLDNIKQLVRSKSQQTLAALSKKEISTEQVNAEFKILGHWMSLILISGESLNLIVKIQFSIDSVQDLIVHSVKGEDYKISEALVKDFVRELINVTAGNIKQTLSENKIKVGINLPVLSRGFDCLYFNLNHRKHSIIDQWKLVHKQSQLFCAIEIETSDELKLENLAENSDLTGDVEFF